MLWVVPNLGLHNGFNKVIPRYRISYNGDPLHVIWSSWSGMCVKLVPFLSSLNWSGIGSHCPRILRDKLDIRNLIEAAIVERLYCCDPAVCQKNMMSNCMFPDMQSWRISRTSQLLTSFFWDRKRDWFWSLRVSKSLQRLWSQTQYVHLCWLSPWHVFVIDHLGEGRDPRRRKYGRESLDCTQVSYQASLPHAIVFGALSPEFQSLESRNKNLEVELQVALIHFVVSRSGGEGFVCDKLTLIFK